MKKNLNQFKTHNELQSNLFLEELARQGLKNVFIAPGSRSTPLVLASEIQTEIEKKVHFDERGLGFLALGCAKKSRLPTALITTSGTAVANLLPSVIEAFYSETPLLILTADRPFELLEVGANQAIQQIDLFENYVLEKFDVPPPSEKTNYLSILTMAAHAYQTALLKKGPVHVNFHFQEPLVPLLNELDTYAPQTAITKYLEGSRPFIEYSGKSQGSLVKVAPELFTNKGIILVGPMISKEDLDPLFKISQVLNYPIFCDVQSPMRFYDFRENIHLFDLLLDLDQSPTPDIVLHFGGSFTSKRVNQWLSKSNTNVIQVHPFLKRLDPNHISKTFFESTPTQFYDAIKSLPMTISKDYVTEWIQKNDIIQNELEQEFEKTLNETTLPFHLFKNKRNAQFFVGSSMPVRDLERFGPRTHRHEVTFNRGASGIDGNLATALGVSMAAKQDLISVMGDLTTLYDLNSLTLLKNHPHQVKLIVINNNGGGIFSFLPVTKIDTLMDKNGVFDKYFSTPHDENFEKIAAAFDLKYISPKTPNELEEALATKGNLLIEISSNRDDNVKFHRDLTRKLRN